MRETFKTENGTTIEVRVTEPERANVTGKIMEIPKGTRMIAENTIKGIQYEYVNTEELNKADFEGERLTDRQKDLQELILTEGFPYQEEVGNFWAGVPDISDDEAFSCNELVDWAETFDKENGSEMGNIHQYALYLASRVKAECWEAVADKEDRIYKRYRIVKDHRAKSSFSYVGGCLLYNKHYSVSCVTHNYYPTYRLNSIVAWVVLPK